jgi:uncharacterized protein
MRPINKIRQAIEAETHRHTVKRGVFKQLHIENMPWLMTAFGLFLKISLLEHRGKANALDVQLEEVEICLPGLPRGFENTKILFISDLHIEGIDALTDNVIAMVEGLGYDFCVLGGDYSFSERIESDVAFSRMVKIATFLTQRTEVFGILGNHDRYSMAECLHQCGVQMLINDSVCVQKEGDSLHLVGLDDGHYYQADDLSLAGSDVPGDAFRVLLCHSPERYELAATAGYALYLAGHTHGGQVCLPNGFAPVTCASTPRALLHGLWQIHDMCGYTSRGCGTSSLPVRFFCPPEITLLTLTGA